MTEYGLRIKNDSNNLQTEQYYHYETNQRLSTNICKRCYRLLPSYLQIHYTKEKLDEKKR